MVMGVVIVHQLRLKRECIKVLKTRVTARREQAGTANRAVFICWISFALTMNLLRTSGGPSIDAAVSPAIASRLEDAQPGRREMRLASRSFEVMSINFNFSLVSDMELMTSDRPNQL
jgi:hypothetical protein